MIILDIIHGSHSRVPNRLGLVEFCKIATIVDYYKCHEIVNMFTDRWLENLGDQTPPRHYGEKFIYFLCVSWVFNWRTHLESMIDLA